MPRNLLLADDSITIQKVVGITFAGEDFSIVAVDNGDDAVRKARELRPDVILADVVMPKRNGYEVCEAVKSDPELAHIPVLLLAGTFEAFDESRAHAVRADAHIAKPFESQALITKVRELLGRGTQSTAPLSAPVIAGLEAAQSAVARPSLAAATPSSSAAPPPHVPSAASLGTPAGSAGTPTWTIPVTPQVPAAGAPPRPPAPSAPSTSVPALGRTSQLVVPPTGSAVPGSVRSPPVLTRAAPPVGAPVAPIVSPGAPDLRAPPAPAGTSTPAPEESFEFLWGHDELPSQGATAQPTTTRTEASPAPRPTVSDRLPTGDLDWAALGFETDAAARAVAGRTVPPEQSNMSSSAASSRAVGPAPSRVEWPVPIAAPPPRAAAPSATPRSVDPRAPETFSPVIPPVAPKPAPSPVPPRSGAEPPFRALAGPGTMPDPSTALLAFGEPIDLADLEVDEEPIPEAFEPAAAHPATVAPQPRAAEAEPAPAVAPVVAPSSPADGGEAQLREALSIASREVIERIAWEIIPTLAETIIREHVERLVRDRDK